MVCQGVDVFACGKLMEKCNGGLYRGPAISLAEFVAYLKGTEFAKYVMDGKGDVFDNNGTLIKVLIGGKTLLDRLDSSGNLVVKCSDKEVRLFGVLFYLRILHSFSSQSGIEIKEDDVAKTVQEKVKEKGGIYGCRETWKLTGNNVIKVPLGLE